MTGEIIRKGDPTDHGGTVLEGSLTDLCHDKPIAYMGHKVHCPKCKGSFPIIEGAPTTTFYGEGVALAGMKTACGATLIATQFTDIVVTGAARRPNRPAPVAALTAAAAAAASQPDSSKEKSITAISWSYGPQKIPLGGASRFYVDLNLHVSTSNYAAGETVDVLVEDDAGADIVDGMKSITLSMQVGADGRATLMNAFEGRTLLIASEVGTA